jgi:hypothetical protein
LSRGVALGLPREQRLDGGEVRLEILGMGDLLEGAGEQLLPAVAGEVAIGLVDEQETAVRRDLADRGAGMFEDDREGIGAGRFAHLLRVRPRSHLPTPVRSSLGERSPRDVPALRQTALAIP